MTTFLGWGCLLLGRPPWYWPEAHMAGKKGCSGGYRPGAGRPAGSTAIKKKGQAKAKKKVVIDLEPSTASVNFLSAFVVKKAVPAADPAATQSVRSPSRSQGRAFAGRCFASGRLSLALCPPSLPASASLRAMCVVSMCATSARGWAWPPPTSRQAAACCRAAVGVRAWTASGKACQPAGWAGGATG